MKVFRVLMFVVLSSLLLAPCAQAQLLASTKNGEILSIDTTTGAGTLLYILSTACGSPQTTEIEFDPNSGIAFAQLPDGTFVGGQFDINTGTATSACLPDGSSLTGMEVVNGVWYATTISAGGGGAPSTLRLLDPTMGATTFVGPTGVGALAGLAYNGTAYAIAGGAGPANLYTINLATGAATLVGTTSIQAGSLEFGPDGRLYAGGTGANSGQIHVIDTATGASTLVGATGFGNITGLVLRSVADLAVAVTAGNATRRVGQAANFTVGIINDGPQGSGATSMTLTLDAALAGMAISTPAGWACTAPAQGANTTTSTCTTADVAANGGPLFNVSVPLTDPLGGQTLSLTAAVAGTSPDPNLGDNTDSATILVTAEANLRLTFTGPIGPVRVGYPVPVFARLDNYGANAAHYPLVTLNVNAPASAVSLATPAGWSCSSGVDKAIQSIVMTASFQCSYLAGLFPRTSVLFPLTITPPASLAGTMVVFDGSAYSQTTDPLPGNNIGSFKLTVRALASFSPVVAPTH